jgi:hypothetical protein
MRRLAGVGAVLLAVSLIACSKDPRTVRVTEANKDRFVEEIKDFKGLTVDESRLLFAFLMRHNLASGLGKTPPSLVGKTVGNLIAEQRTFETDAKKREEEQVRLAAEARAKEDALAAELRKAISLTVFEKRFLGSDAMAGRYQDYITTKCVYENTSGKDIRAFNGSVRFTDLFDKPILESSLTITDPIKAGAKATWNGSINYNQFIDSHQSLRNTDLKDMKVVWIPKSIIYADGSRVGSTEQ